MAFLTHIRLLVFAVLIASLSAQVAHALETGSEAPAFQAAQLGSGALRFNPKKLQKPTLLVFWASWCGSCRYEIPELSELFNTKRSQVDIVGISIDSTLDKAQGFSQKFNMPYKNVFDDGGRIADQFGIYRTPSLILIDKNGQIREQGYRLKKLLPTLESLINPS